MAELSPFCALRRTAKADGAFEDALSQGSCTAAQLRGWLADGKLKQDTAPGLIIYEQEFSFLGQKRKIKGFFSLVKIEDGCVFPHESADPAEMPDDLTRLEETGCQFSPVHCLFEDDERKTMSRIHLLSSGKPRFEFSENGVLHRLWAVNDILVIRAIQEDFAGRRLYLIDGDSRWAAAQEWKKRGGSDFALLFLADTEQEIALQPSHCLVRGLKELDEPKFLADCEPYFQVIPRGTTAEIAANLDALYRQGKKAFAFYSGGASWTLLILKDSAVTEQLLPGRSEPFRGLNVSILHSLVLERLLKTGIRAAGEEDTLSFTPSVETALSAVQNGFAQCAFLLNPARKKEILEICEAGEKMQPNSAHIYPPIPMGMVMASFNER